MTRTEAAFSDSRRREARQSGRGRATLSRVLIRERAVYDPGFDHEGLDRLGVDTQDPAAVGVSAGSYASPAAPRGHPTMSALPPIADIRDGPPNVRL